MLSQSEEQALALCGLLQCCTLVDELARTGQCDSEEKNAMLGTLFVTNPERAQDVYLKPHLLQSGQKSLLAALGDQQESITPQPFRYALALMHLQQKLSKRGDLLNKLGERVEHSANQITHFDIGHENVVASLAATYQETISTFNMRIQVAGHARHLQVEHNAAKIRALLLAGIRSATLWRQVGGHRWHFLFSKGRIKNAAKALSGAIESGE